MQKDSGNMQFQPYTTVQTSYCRIEFSSDFPIRYMKGDIWYTKSYNITTVHFHNCLQIGYCYKGEGYSLIDGSLYPYKTDYVSIIPPRIQHHCTSQPNRLSRWKWLYLDPMKIQQGMNPEFTKKLMQVMYSNKLTIPYTVNTETEPEIVAIIKSIIDAMESERQGFKDIVRLLVNALLIMILRTARQQDGEELATSLGSNLNIIAPAIQHISNYYMHPLTISGLAELCYISETHLRRIFHKVMNCSPLEYLQMVRLEAACVLLLHTEASVLEIGGRVGFPTETSFIRQFKKYFDITPGKWRRKIFVHKNE